jgi:hypothetical protein
LTVKLTSGILHHMNILNCRTEIIITITTLTGMVVAG